MIKSFIVKNFFIDNYAYEIIEKGAKQINAQHIIRK